MSTYCQYPCELMCMNYHAASAASSVASVRLGLRLRGTASLQRIRCAAGRRHRRASEVEQDPRVVRHHHDVCRAALVVDPAVLSHVCELRDRLRVPILACCASLAIARRRPGCLPSRLPPLPLCLCSALVPAHHRASFTRSVRPDATLPIPDLEVAWSSTARARMLASGFTRRGSCNSLVSRHCSRAGLHALSTGQRLEPARLWAR